MREKIILNAEQEQFVKDNYLFMNDETMGIKLKCTQYVIRKRREELGLRRPDRRHSEELINIVREYGGKISDTKLGEMVGMTSSSVGKVRRSLGIGAYKPTYEEQVKKCHAVNICFDCQHATHSDVCIWARDTMEYPRVIQDGIEQTVTLGECGEVMSCPIFERDAI